MLVGGIWALVSMRRSLVSGIRSGFYAEAQRKYYDHTQQDTPMTFAMLGIVIFVIPIFFVYYSIVGTLGIGLIMTVIMVVTGFLFSSVAAYMAGMVGSSQNPISGITIATILFSSLLLLWFMGASVVGAAAAIMIGSVVC